jgi:hypothetical protein
MSAIITLGLRSVSLDAKICRPPAKQNPTICAYCRSFLERPLAPRCTYASPPEHDLIVLGPQDCRFCQMLLDERAHLMAPYKQSEPFKVKVYFEDEYLHRTHRSNSPRQTTCRIEIENQGRISDEDDEEHNAIFEVKPIFNKTFRRETPSSQIIRPLVARNTRDVRALEFIKYWTTECRLHHKTCNNSIAAMVGHSSDCPPKRLISVNRNNRLRLMMPVKTRPPQDYRYTTLTHKWGKGESLRLSRKIWINYTRVLCSPHCRRHSEMP